MSKVILFGAGTSGHDFYNAYKKRPDIYLNEVLAFTDNSQILWNNIFEGIKVIKPDELCGMEFDYVVITSIYKNQIKSQLKEMGVLSEKIYSMEEYKYKCYSEYQYRKRYAEYSNRKNTFDKEIVIYTAITGIYDDLKEPLFQDDGIEYVCFTNNRSLKSSVWNIEYVSDNSLNDMYLAKKLKMFPELYFKEYETSVWVDGKFLIKDDFRRYIEKYEKSQPVICFPHFSRNCIYEEMAECISIRKGDRKKMLQQCITYYQDNYPVNNGLYEMGCIVRKHHDGVVKKLMKEWWQQINRYSNRDQISFPYICWKNNFKPDICDLSINRNLWLSICAHNS